MSLKYCFFVAIFILFAYLAPSVFADETSTTPPVTAEDEYRPPMNAIPELYPEKYPGLVGRASPHDVPIPTFFNWCQNHVCSPNLQQHIEYTPLCFLHASYHMLSDRINYEFEKQQLGIPAVYLSRQDYLNYAHLFGFGANPLQDGGEGVDVMEYARQYGIPDETCNPWQSDGKNHQKNDTNDRCINCMMMRNDKNQHCWPVKNFVKYRVDSYGFVRGEKQMMNEIFHTGPIQCGLVVDDEMIFNYAGGVYNDYGRCADMEVDHDVEIVGWGERTEKNGDITKYWVIRNSWGSNIFGTNGFFLLNRGNNTLRIEERCLFAKPDISELIQHLQGENVGTMFGLISPQKGDKVKLLPDDWDSSPHDYYTKKELQEAAEEAQKQDKWMDEYIFTPRAEADREKDDADITIGSPKSSFRYALEWVFSITGLLIIGLSLALACAVWLYLSQPSSSSDGYEPIPHGQL